MWLVPLLCSIGLATTVGGAVAAELRMKAARESLLREYPKALLRDGGKGTWSIAGQSMRSAETPALAAQEWLERHALAFGIEAATLVKESQRTSGALNVHRYRQAIGGVPVDGSLVHVLTTSSAPSRVIAVSGTTIEVPAGGFPKVRISGTEALRSIESNKEWAGFARWSEPELAIAHLDPDPVQAWRFSGKSQAGDHRTFYVDAATGKLVVARQNWRDAISVSGQVSGNRTPRMYPDNANNPPSTTVLPDVKVILQVGGPPDSYVFSAANGLYSIGDASGSSGMIVGQLVGPSVSVTFNGSLYSLEIPVTSSSSNVPIRINNVPEEFATSMVNAHYHVTGAHDFYAALQPNFNDIDQVLDTRVNGTGACNAFFFPSQCSAGPDLCYDNGDCIGQGTCTPEFLGFLRAGTDPFNNTCPNASYSSIISHEYGHFVHWKLGIFGLTEADAAFDEGFGDTFSIIRHDDPVIAREFLSGADGRNIDTADVQWPCTIIPYEPHACGQLLAGVWWDTKKQLQSALGSSTGLATARELFGEWSQITVGPDNHQAAGPNTLVEVLTVDDDDADFCTLTPHWEEICKGFEEHSIECPLADTNENDTNDDCE
jgi:hypothetical protein